DDRAPHALDHAARARGPAPALRRGPHAGRDRRAHRGVADAGLAHHPPVGCAPARLRRGAPEAAIGVARVGGHTPWGVKAPEEVGGYATARDRPPPRRPIRAPPLPRAAPGPGGRAAARSPSRPRRL